MSVAAHDADAPPPPSTPPPPQQWEQQQRGPGTAPWYHDGFILSLIAMFAIQLKKSGAPWDLGSERLRGLCGGTPGCLLFSVFSNLGVHFAPPPPRLWVGWTEREGNRVGDMRHRLE
ncbi:hypothetical protein HETIRDRAFT_449441 [Heterobasidion irregulare TC 32-1]|uniref:Uncharacterized protein n=1 Tax=Heterobasidion irregulare (strain TC 32-1) TaxID=747525 RepID=W4KFJ8_HETIT|nr:uncharacterized protein HETIRDRAFT_449441 [Heterobasidion irregulare TC 32-1]ETW83806.1 hypothetical protein HETIRDRAFT_449441 [Heterobasidion irregulare TC 32-1]